MDLPNFKYHPDPIATGSIIPSEVECKCCDERRGFVYVGPIFSVEELSECICPWCIADGSAHEKFDAEFTDASGIGGYSQPAVIPKAAVEEVAFRTPGFSGWQQEHWMTCCGDAAAFVGRAGRAELEHEWPDAVASIQQEYGGDDGEDWQSYWSALDKNGSPSAYVFRCLHCGKHLGYSDCN